MTREEVQAEIERVSEALAAPFDASEVKWKPGSVSGNRAMAIPFIDARVVQDRLDEVLGVMGWQDSYDCHQDGSVVCRLKIRIGDEWIVKEDVGGQSEQPDEGDRRKAAFSDALKRAAVKFGIGRFLYRQKPIWVDYDPQKRKFASQPVLTAPPARATAPRPAPKPQPVANGFAGPAPTAPPAARTVLDVAKDYDAYLAKEGVSDKGALIAYLDDQHGQEWSAIKGQPAGTKEQQTPAGARAKELFVEYAQLQREAVEVYGRPD